MWPLIAGMANPITLSHQVRSGGWKSMISANGGLPAHRYTPQVTPRWPRGSEPASARPAPFPLPALRSLLGEGGRPLGSGGLGVGAPAVLKPGGERGGAGGGGGGGASPPPPSPPPRRVSACHPLSPARPPGVYSCCGGCRAAVGVRRGLVARQWVSAAGRGEGGEGVIFSPWHAPPPSPGRPLRPAVGQ